MNERTSPPSLPAESARIALATLWVAGSEFLRNDLVFGQAWQHHWSQRGMSFPNAPINGATWALWSLVFVVAIRIIADRFELASAMALCWVMGFVLMWLVLGNLDMLPEGLLWGAIPMSIVEVAGAVLIVRPANRRGVDHG